MATIVRCCILISSETIAALLHFFPEHKHTCVLAPITSTTSTNRFAQTFTLSKLVLKLNNEEVKC